MQNQPASPEQADTFICHASEDKETMARPLHKGLTDIGLHAWLDESDIPRGESIRRNIDMGLSQCKSATVILSRIFFSKYWTQYELDGIFQRRMSEGMPVLPIQHGITIEEIRSHSPSLAGLRLLNSNDFSIEQIAEAISERLGGLRSGIQQPTGQPVISAPSGGRTFGVIYIAPTGTPVLPDTLVPERHGFASLGQPRGWVRMVDNDEELEYVIDRDKLRVQLDRRGQWNGGELQADQLSESGNPFSMIIRRDGEPQVCLPSLASTSDRGFLYSPGSPSGWRTFQIQA